MGGDYYDFIRPQQQNSTYMVIGDVKGKGMAAALYMVRVHALLQ
ncbi:MAG: SpoIIE family protein phosphatase, partial [Calditrichae bacterium]|nr:SpoIIE family protein phosphatase [Calditrichia bacterium]